MGVEEMAPTDAHRHAGAGSVDADEALELWGAGKAEREEAERLLAQIRSDMERSVNRRRSLRQSKREAAKHSRVAAPDPTAWRAELQDLLDRGIDDVNVGFWRVSTLQQTEDEGPERQQAAIVGHSIAHTERGVDLWVYDVDSGSEESRVGLDFLLEAMETGTIASVTVERLDRIARNQWLGETVNRAAFKNKVALRSATEHIPKGPVGDLLRQILQAIAQYELALIKSRLSGGKRVKREREGTSNGGETPYGYLAAGNGYMAVCEPEARIIRLIFILYELGYNQSAIADALNRWGIPTRLGGKLGWRQGQIRRILRNEAAYRAEALFTKTILEPQKIAHQPILEHREDPSTRTYVFGTVETRKRHEVSDDLVLRMPKAIPQANSFHVLTAEQAVCLKTMFALRDRGLSIAKVVEELNRMGMKTLTGREWKWTNAQQYLARRDQYETAIQAAGATDADVRCHLDPAAHEAACVERIMKLRADGMSIPKIQAVLGEEGLKTASGAEWSLSSIHRVCAGKRRQAISNDA
jgi:DNA invertase Pin-like site-specific DNA recombinase